MKKEAGSAHLIILLSLVIIVVLAFVGYRVFNQEDQNKNIGTSQTDTDGPEEGKASDARSTSAIYENAYYKFTYPEAWKSSSSNSDPEKSEKVCFHTSDSTKAPQANSPSCNRASSDTFAAVQILNPSREYTSGIDQKLYLPYGTEGTNITLGNGSNAYKFSGVIAGTSYITIRIPYPSGQWVELGYTYNASNNTHETEFMELVNSVQVKRDATSDGVGG